MKNQEHTGLNNMKNNFSKIVQGVTVVLLLLLIICTPLFNAYATGNPDGVDSSVSDTSSGATAAEEATVKADTSKLLKSSSGDTSSSTTSSSLNYTTASTNCLTKIAASFLSRYVAGALKSLVGDKVSSAVTGVTSSKVPVRASDTETEIQTVQKKVQNADENSNKWTSVFICIGNELIQQVTASTVSWIKNDFKNADGTKGPGFITNPGKFFTGVADRAAGNFILGLGDVGSILCKPFDVKIRLALLKEYQASSTVASCTLTSIKKNFSNFGKTDYWGDWFQLTQQDNNNYIGSYLNARDQMKNAVNYNQSKNQLEITLGKGFLDFKECPDNKKTCAESEMKHSTPGSQVQAQLNTVLGAEANRIQVATSIDTLLSTLINTLLKRATTGLLDQK